MQVGLAPSLKRAGEFKKRLHLLVFHARRITDMATARHAVRAGRVDTVGMTRAHIADRRTPPVRFLTGRRASCAKPASMRRRSR